MILERAERNANNRAHLEIGVHFLVVQHLRSKEFHVVRVPPDTTVGHIRDVVSSVGCKIQRQLYVQPEVKE